MFEGLVNLVRELYGTRDFIPLHEPRFFGNEKKFLLDTIDSTYVSSVGDYVENFESAMAEYTGAEYAVATVNGTSALHVALLLAGVRDGDEVITQSLTFVATCNAIRYCNADPVFVDVDRQTLGLSAQSLESLLEEKCEVRDDGFCWNRNSGKIVRACLPMHCFGFPVDFDEISNLCERYNIVLVEDAAESLGSLYRNRHTGTLAEISALSFNGNKVITTGGGGMLLIKNEALARRAKHITTTARVRHEWAFEHDELGFNYRLPNLNAALGVAQLESLSRIVQGKRELAARYLEWGEKNGFGFFREPAGTLANYWLNTLITDDMQQRDELLEYTNKNNVMTRPAWMPMHRLPMYQSCQKINLNNTEWLQERIVNVPSSLPMRP